MLDWGSNPRHGWDQGPWNGMDSPAGFFPAPPGMSWYELPVGGGVQGWYELPLGSGGPGWHELPVADDWNHIKGAGYQNCWYGGGGQGWHELPVGGFCAPGLPGPPMMGGLQYLGPPIGFGGGYGGYGGPPCWPSSSPLASFPSTGQYQMCGDVNDDGIPGLNLRNPYGGIGIPPGTNYLFPSSHCKIMVIKSSTPPWQLDPPAVLNYKPFQVPTNMTVKEVMKQFGCDNEDAEKNVMTECVRGANGKWYKGTVCKGDNKDLMKTNIEEIGWRGERDGVKEDCVWVWFTK